MRDKYWDEEVYESHDNAYDNSPQKPDIISTVVFLYGSWELVEEFWMKKEKGEREYDKQKDVVVLEE